MSQDKATPRPWETTGASRIWKTGDTGGAIAIIAEPECKNSGDFQEVWIDSPRWDEAMANAELIVRAVNSFDELLAACKHAVTILYEIHSDHREAQSADSNAKLIEAAITKAEKP